MVASLRLLQRPLVWLSISSLALLLACGASDDASNGDPNAAGSPATAGNAGAPIAGGGASGGPAATAGMPATGGAGNAGAAGAGGAAGGAGGSGGAAGSAGASAGSGGALGGAGGSGGTAGSGGNGGNGGSGGESYHPCNNTPCKVMPLGDSITFGVGDEPNGGYRGPLFAAIVAGNRNATFTGSGQNGPTMVSGQPFPRRHEGHSGWGISRVTPYSGGNAGIATQIPSPAFDAGSGGKPDIILLHIGTNDASNFTAAQMTSDLSGLLDKLATNAPEAYIFVAQIIPLGYGTNDVIKTYNQAIPGIVQQKSSAGKHVALVDLFTGFDTKTMLVTDNIHPNTKGYQFMAQRWYEKIGPLLTR